MNDGAFEMTCQAHPDYTKNQTADFALCLLSRDFAGVPEKVNTDSHLLKRGDKVYIAGYGCRVVGGVDAATGDLSVGEARVLETPPDTGRDLFATTFGAALCFGDAGGAAYFYPDEGPASRLLIGVNARGDMNQQSLIAITGTKLFSDWAIAWIQENGVPICGIGDESGCRAGEAGAIAEGASRAEVRARLNANAPSLFLPEQSFKGLEVTQSSRVLKAMARSGEKLADFVTRVCRAPQSEDYFAQLEQYNKMTGAGFDRTVIFTTEREVVIPVCAAPPSRIRVVQTTKKDTVKSLYTEVLAGNTLPRWRGLEHPSGVTDRGEKSEYFRDVLAALNRGINIDNLGNKFVRVPLTPVSIEDNAPAVGAAPGSLEPIFALQSDGETCAATKPGPGYPVDLSAVFDVLRENRHNERRPPGRGVVVLVADSGVYGAGPFTEEVLAHRVAFDQTYLDEIAPLNDGPEPRHGTQVASVVLGGPLFARIQANWEPRIKLAIMRIYRKYVQNGRELFSGEDQAFERVLEVARSYSVQVINLSLKTHSQILALESEFKANSPFLFVAAAGNGDGLIGTPEKTIYPALYGGTGGGQPNVLTVAGLEGNGTLASFSNYSPDFVDIGAYGCLIPVLSYYRGQESRGEESSWKTEYLNGTSLSAPLVSFTAAMLKSEMRENLTAVDTKRRILVSADLNPALVDKIADGRTLNIVKALSLYQDVVELSNHELLFGQIRFAIGRQKWLEESDTFEVVCSDRRRLPVKIQDIYKIRPRFGASPDTGRPYAKIYLKAPPPAQSFMKRDCELPSDLSIIIHDQVREKDRFLEFNEVDDIVRKYR